MKRLTTGNQDHILASLNLFYAKGNEVWVRGGGPACPCFGKERI